MKLKDDQQETRRQRQSYCVEPDSLQILQVHNYTCSVVAKLLDVQMVLGYKFCSWETAHFLFFPASAVGSPHFVEVRCYRNNSSSVLYPRLSDRFLPECQVAPISGPRGEH